MIVRTIRRARNFTRPLTPAFTPVAPCRRVFGQKFYSGTPSKVEKILLDNIKATGPFSYSTYMNLCLSHPTDGYYANPQNAVFGTQGDFITSPEISQVFGELVGVWLLSIWAKVTEGKTPPKIRLIELGPGRGTLMNDVLRTFAQFTPKGTIQEVHMVETSRSMREIQKAILTPGAQAGGWELAWLDSIEELEPSEEAYTMIVAHEFFDALPIHVLKNTKNGWREILIASTLNAAASSSQPDPTASSTPPPSRPLDVDTTAHQATEGGTLCRVLAPGGSISASVLASSSPRFQALAKGSTLEVSPTAYRTSRKIGELIAPEKSTSAGGCALIVDYGADHHHEDSFRAFKNHKMVDVFHRPGECDLTADVDFRYLKESVADLASLSTHGPISQGTFLERMGIYLRLDRLRKSFEAAGNTESVQTLEEASKRLTDPSGMGSQYQVFAMTSKPAAPAADEDIVWPFIEEATSGEEKAPLDGEKQRNEVSEKRTGS